MKKIFIALLFTSVGFTGCQKYLDIKPKGYTIPEFYEDYAKLLNSLSLYSVSSAYPNYLTDDVQAGIDKNVNTPANYLFYALYKRNLYEFQHGAVFEDGQSDSYYEPAYTRIFTFNAVINNIEKVTDGTEVGRKRLKAEAQVGRAFEYFNLVNVYAPHYDPATAATDLGVPLVLTEDISAKYNRNTVAEVYQLVKSDLEEALPNLGLTAPHKFRPTQDVGYAFLSKLNLYMGNYAEALRNANEALKLNSDLNDYSIYTTRKGTWGRVHQIGNPAISYPDPRSNKETIWAKNSADIYMEVYASEDLINTYKTDLATGAVDMRFSLFFHDGQAQFGTNIVFFPGRVLWGAFIEANAGFSAAELFLIAAECEARIGSKDKAVEHLNTLRNKRITGNMPLVAASAEDALRMALQERRRELAYLGVNRLVDLKRLNKDSRFQKTVTHINQGKTYTLPPNDKRYILPIPPKVLALNPGIPVYDR